MPRLTCSGIARSRPYRTISLPIVVDSPPGRMSPSTPARSPGSRTSTSATPRRRRMARCSITSPWTASTPIFTTRLHSSSLQQFALGQLSDIEAPHRLADALGDPRDHVRIVIVRGRLDDRLGALGRVLGLEDAGADEVPIAAELHHHRGVRRGGEPPPAKVYDGQAPK